MDIVNSPHLNSRHQAGKNFGMGIVLPLSIALHALVLSTWPLSTSHRPGSGFAEPITVRIWPARPEPPAAIDRHDQSAPASRAEKAQRPLRTMPVLPDADMRVAEPHDPSAAAPSLPSAGEMIRNATRDIGRLDKEMRKSYPSLPQSPPKTVQSQLEKGIAAAGRPTTQTMEAKTLADGRRITKVSGPGGTYCVTHDSVANSGGIDQMQNGIQGKVTNCDSF